MDCELTRILTSHHRTFNVNVSLNQKLNLDQYFSTLDAKFAVLTRMNELAAKIDTEPVVKEEPSLVKHVKPGWKKVF